MVQPSCGFRDSSPAEFWMMSCWSFSLQGCHCWDLRGKSICPLPLKTYIRLCKVVKRSGFFVGLVIQVIPGIIHWMKNSLKLYLHNSRRILGVLGGFFLEKNEATLSSSVLESPALRQTVMKSYCAVCFVTRLGQMVLWMVVSFRFTFGILRSTRQSVGGAQFLGSSAGVTGRLGCLGVVCLLMKREIYKVSSF